MENLDVAKTEKPKVRIPTLAELVEQNESTYKETALTVLLNQNPPAKWIKGHPYVSIEIEANGQLQKAPMPYLPIDKVEFLLNRIYGGFQTVIKDVKVVANSVVVVVTVTVKNPITGLYESHDGVAAVAIQTDKGAGAMDWNFAKSNGVQIAAPAAETYAIKDAAEKFGRIFGRDLTRRDTLGYDGLLTDPEATWDDKERILNMINNSTYDSDTQSIMTEKVMSGITISEGMAMSKDLAMNQLSLKETGRVNSMKDVNSFIDKAMDGEVSK